MNWREKLAELKEGVAYTMIYAPDRFPYRDFRPPDGQMNLDRIYEEMQAEFAELAKARGESPDDQRLGGQIPQRSGALRQCFRGHATAQKNCRRLARGPR